MAQWDDLRADFPALAHGVHLNAAGASPTPRPVRAAVDGFLREMEEGADTRWLAWIARREEVRAAVARLVGAEPDEIAFVPNTSTGINLVADLIAADGPVLTPEIEFPALTLPWIHRGTPVHFLPVVEGVVRLEPFQAGNAPRAATLAIGHVQFANGGRLDLDAVGALKGGRHLVVGASQSAGAFPIDVRAARIDALASCGHKWLCAGYGAGFVYVSRDLLARRPHAIGWMSVRDPFAFRNHAYELLPSAQRVEVGTPAFATIFALGAAVGYLQDIGIAAIADRVLFLNGFLTFLLEREGFTVLSPGAERRSGSTLVAVADPRAAHTFLQDLGIRVTRKPEGLRIATHFYNTESDVEVAVRALREYRKGAGA